MTARADTTIWFDRDLPTVRARAIDTDRAMVNIDDVLTLFGPADTLRATLTAALAALDGLQP